MSNKKSRQNNRLWTAGIIAVVAALVIAYFVSNNETPIDPASFADLEVFEDQTHIKGNPDVEFVLVEYSDLECPACKNTAPILDTLTETFADQLAIEYRHFPLTTIHPNALEAARATEAAAVQGKFWEMHDKLFETQGVASEWTQSFNPEKYFIEYAEELGLNVDRFRFDLESDEIADRVRADIDAGKDAGVTGTPGFTLNGEIVDLNQFIVENLDISRLEVVEEESAE